MIETAGGLSTQDMLQIPGSSSNRAGRDVHPLYSNAGTPGKILMLLTQLTQKEKTSSEGETGKKKTTTDKLWCT